MQIVCPNCTTAYEIPDAVFGGRARKLRCENCGTQWRAGPPGDEAGAADSAIVSGLTDPGVPPAAPGRVFGKPVDAAARAEFQQARDREVAERARQAAAAAAQPVTAEGGSETEDPFINLVMAARSRNIEFEPEPPPEPRIRISSPAFVGTLLTLFVLSVGFLLIHAR
jgi:predicted Zn finger-like uncharacterized protein